jgi:hypothetical protein
MFRPFDCVVVLFSLCRGRALRSDLARADDTGLDPKESIIETLCGLPDGLAGGGFRIPMRYEGGLTSQRGRLLGWEQYGNILDSMFSMIYCNRFGTVSDFYHFTLL